MRSTDKPGLAFWIQVRMLRLLGWSHGLEAWLSLMALCWGASLLVYPSFWTTTWSNYRSEFPVTPLHLAWLLALSGAVGLIGIRAGKRIMRMQTSVIAFMSWSCLCVYDIVVPPLPLIQAVVMHGLIALAELGVYVRILIGFDKRENQLGRYISRPDAKPPED